MVDILIEEQILAKEQELKSLKQQLTKPTLKLENSVEKNLKTGTRTNGLKYSVRDNRDRIIMPKEWIAFYEKLKESQKPVFFSLINTGARINELLNVLVEDIDIDNKRIILRVTKIKAKKGEKNPRPRIIPISSQYAQYLKKYIKEYQLEGKDFLVQKCASKPAVHIALKTGLKRAGITDWYMISTHNIRKSFETWLMALGIDGLKLTAHLGHSLQVAAGSYISADIFSYEEKDIMRRIIGDLYK